MDDFAIDHGLNNGQMENTFIIKIHSRMQLGNFESASNHCNKLQMPILVCSRNVF